MRRAPEVGQVPRLRWAEGGKENTVNTFYTPGPARNTPALAISQFVPPHQTVLLPPDVLDVSAYNW